MPKRSDEFERGFYLPDDYLADRRCQSRHDSAIAMACAGFLVVMAGIGCVTVAAVGVDLLGAWLR